MVAIEEIEETIVRLHKEGKGMRDIAKSVRKNFTFIGQILEKRFPEEYAKASNSVVTSIETQAIKLFSEGKSPEQVVIMLDQKPEDVMNWYGECLRLKGKYAIVKTLEDFKEQSRSLLNFLQELQKSKLGLKGATEALKDIRRIRLLKNELAELKLQIAFKWNELAELELKRQDYSEQNRRYSGFMPSISR